MGGWWVGFWGGGEGWDLGRGRGGKGGRGVGWGRGVGGEGFGGSFGMGGAAGDGGARRGGRGGVGGWGGAEGGDWLVVGEGGRRVWASEEQGSKALKKGVVCLDKDVYIRSMSRKTKEIRVNSKA